MSPQDNESSRDPSGSRGEGGAEIRSPFEVEPRDLSVSRKGCSRMAIAGCGLVALVIGLAVLTMLLKASDLVGWSLSQIRTEVERALPSDLPVAERARLDAAFDAAIERVESGDLDAVAFQELQAELLRFARRTEPPSVDDVRTLSEALERFAGIELEMPAANPTAVT